MKKVIVSFVCASALAIACSASPGDGGVPPAATAEPAATDVSADQVEVVQGVPDRGRDPAVVAIDIGGTALCTGSLIAPGVVLTARHCVANTVEQIQCPATAPQVSGQHSPSSLHILVGDDASIAREVARGRAIVAPKGWALCDQDIALIVLDRDVTEVSPLAVRAHGIAKGDHVRAVGFGRAGDGEPAGIKLLRDHVRVVETSDAEFVVGEATCQGDSGGPAIDESTGEIVGVVSRGGPACDGTNVHNIYTRTDVFLPLIEEALREAEGGDGGDEDAGAPGKDAGKHKDAGPKSTPPVSDMGGACHSGRDCSAGVCVKDQARQYCSRPCGTNDRCPARYNCKKATNGAMVCVEK